MRKDPITRFQELLRFPTISSLGSKGSYNDCAKWLEHYILEIGLDCKVFYLVPNKPIILATWTGINSSLPSILLNSHYDVVPAIINKWNHDPFGGEILDNGNIIGRGTQDMKSVCIQYLEAIYNLKLKGFHPCRNIYLTFMPDEENGGVDGMKRFVESNEFKNILPIAFAFDEGLANPTDAFTVFYGERIPWWIQITATGPTGHGSRLIKGTAMEKIISICNKALTFRKEQEDVLNLDKGCCHSDFKKKKLGDVTTINLTMLNGGLSQDNGKTYELNVIPTTATAGFDIRIPPHVDLKEFEETINKWCEDDTITWKFVDWSSPLKEHYVTSINKDENSWWKKFTDICDTLNMKIEPEIFPAATDSRFLRKLNIPSLGFSPMNHTPILLHEHNEMISKDIFLRGIQIYEDIFNHLFRSAI